MRKTERSVRILAMIPITKVRARRLRCDAWVLVSMPAPLKVTPAVVRGDERNTFAS